MLKTANHEDAQRFMGTEAAIIAVVDDDAVLVEGVAGLIRSLGYQAITFTSATDFLRNNTAAFDCVVSDVKMPGMSGLDLLAKLRADHPFLPVILISAFMDEVRRTEAIAAGAVCILSKPFDDDDLESCIIEALSR
jgi:FixJ family two-component response regulator